MGLDTSHDCWHGSYGSFNRWRNWLAQRIGLPLQCMETFCGPRYGPPKWTAKLEYEEIEYKGIPWSLLKPDPLYILLNHSDCDGIIPLENLPALEQRLREIIETTPKEEDIIGPDTAANYACHDSMIAATKRFADGCLKAIEAGEDVDFH